MNKITAVIIIGLALVLVGAMAITAQIGGEPAAVTSVYSKTSTGFSDFIKEDFNSKYGGYKLEDKDGDMAEYSLTSTKESIIDISMEGKANLYKDGTLFDDVKYIGSGQDKYYIQVTRDNYVDVIDTYKKQCETVVSIKDNETKEEECYDVPDTYKQVNQPITSFEVYNNEVLKSGDYYWKWEGTRGIREIVDVQPVKSDIAFKEWVWYNLTWNYTQTINISNTMPDLTMLNMTTINMSVNTSTLVNTGKMQNDCDDLRIVYNDVLEKNRLIENCNNTNTRVVFSISADILANQSNSNYKMYYGNTGAANPPINDTMNYIYIWKDDLISDKGGWTKAATATTFGANGISVNGGSSSLITTRNIGDWNDNLYFTINETLSAHDWGWMGVRFTNNTANVVNFSGITRGSNRVVLANGTYFLDGNQGLSLGQFATSSVYLTRDRIWGGGTILTYNSTNNINKEWKRFGFGSNKVTNTVTANNLLIASYYYMPPTVTLGAESGLYISINGLVLTPTGTVISGAKVVILNSAGTLVANTTSNATGGWTYSFANGTLSNYTIIGYNPSNTSQGGAAYPFFNG